MIYRSHYKTRVGRHCGLGCFCNYCRYWDIHLNEEDIFFLGDGFHLIYNEQETCHGRVFSLSIEIFESLFTFCKKYHLEFINEDATENEEVLKLLEVSILKDECISINIPPAYCHYASAATKRASSVTLADRCVVGSTHFVNPIGLDRCKQKIFISDSCIPDFYYTAYHGWADFREIQFGWHQTRCEFFIFEANFWQKLKIVIQELDIKTLLIKKLIVGLTEFLSVPPIFSGRYTGIYALRKIQTMCEYLVDQSNRAFLLQYFFSEWVNDSTAYHYYIAAAVEKILPHHEILNDIRELIRKWERFLMSVLKSSISDNEDRIRQLPSKIKCIIDLEKDLYTRLLRLLLLHK